MKKTFLALMAFVTMCVPLGAQTVLTVAAYPAVDDIIRAALPDWQKKHPQVQVKVVGQIGRAHV